MKVGIVTSYYKKQPAGLERYLLDLVAHLKLGEGVEYFVYLKKGSGFEEVLMEKSIHGVGVIEVGWGRLWKHIGLFFAPRADVYVFNGPIVPLFFNPKRYFVILHDFAYKHLRSRNMKDVIKRTVMDFLTKKAINKSKKIITVSNYTSEELMKFFQVKNDKIVTIYPGFNHICEIEENVIKNVSEPYFLSIGTLKERKNAVSAVEAFAKYKHLNTNKFKLVIVGKKDAENRYVKKLIATAKEHQVVDDIIFTGYLSEAQISFVYRHATALIFPSLVEGFGFPILEAMSCGVPVITSNIGALAEVGRGAALLVDPLNTDLIAQAMAKVVSDRELKDRLIKDGLARIGRFSWHKTADEFHELIVNS